LPINQPPSPSNIQDQHTYCGHYSVTYIFPAKCGIINSTIVCRLVRVH
jgi:hypothetical protein